MDRVATCLGQSESERQTTSTEKTRERKRRDGCETGEHGRRCSLCSSSTSSQKVLGETTPCECARRHGRRSIASIARAFALAMLKKILPFSLFRAKEESKERSSRRVVPGAACCSLARPSTKGGRCVLKATTARWVRTRARILWNDRSPTAQEAGFACVDHLVAPPLRTQRATTGPWGVGCRS